MSQKTNTPKILTALLIGMFMVIVGTAMLNTIAGIIGGIAMFIFLLCHDD